ncbi:MAG: cell division protein FtsN [Methylophagaceae bacterium]|jgi:cell division protein FtsN
MVTKRTNRRKPEKQSLPIAPMLISFAVGAFVMFLLQIKDTVPIDTVVKSKPKVSQNNERNTIEPTFDFYDILPEMEVKVDRPKVAIKQQLAQKEVVKTAAIEKSGSVSYLIQVGSFRNPTDADGFKARVALLGIESKVQTVTIDNTETWHRVLIGPIVGRGKADGIQKQLKKNKIDSFLLRTRRS